MTAHAPPPTPLPSRLRLRLEAIQAGTHRPSAPMDWEDADLVAEGLIEIRRDRGRSWAEITERGRAALRGSR